MKSAFEPRPMCHACWRGGGTCYCKNIQPFEAEFSLVLLVHPREARNRVGTVRIAHLSVKGSLLVAGTGLEIDRDPRALQFLNRERYFPAVLFPGDDAVRVEKLTRTPEPNGGGAQAQRIYEGKKLALFVIDGTWSQASQMVRTSKLLSSLPKLSFSPDRSSEYQFRRQPHEYCLSTVEAVHTLIDRMDAAGVQPAPPDRAHDRMLEVFRELVRFQIQCERETRTDAVAATPRLPEGALI